MDYSKVLSSKPVRSKKSEQSQPKKRTEEQSNLLKFVASLKKQDSTNNDRPKILRPAFYNHNLRANGNYQKKYSEPHRSCTTVHKVEKETIEDKRIRLKELLKNFESPFLWGPKDIKPLTEPRLVYQHLQQKDEEIKDEKKFKWRNFILQIIMVYELYNMKEISKALEKINHLEEVLTIQQNGRDWLFMGIKEALWHVVEASKLFLLLEMDALTEAEHIVRLIQPLRSFSRNSQAGLHGIRAAVFMEYGHRGNVKALNEAMKAVELDRTVAEWHFLLGKSMRRIRRLTKCHDLLDPVEEKAFSTALELEKRNPTYMLYVAQMLREKVLREYRAETVIRKSDKDRQLRKIAAASFYKYKKANQLRPDCPHMLTRCAFGVMKVLPDFVDLKYVRETIDKALELAPQNMMAHHVKALYYERFTTDLPQALVAMEKAYSLGNFGAGMDLVRMHYHMHRPGIVEELDNLAERFEEPSKRQVAYAQAGSYYLFIEKDLVKAVEYYLKVIDIDDDSYALKSHKPIFFPLKYPINLFYVVLVELKSNTVWDSFPKEEKKILRNFLFKTSKHEEKRVKDLERKENLKDTELHKSETEKNSNNQSSFEQRKKGLPPEKMTDEEKRVKDLERKEKIKETAPPKNETEENRNSQSSFEQRKKCLPPELMTVKEVLRITRCRRKVHKGGKKLEIKKKEWRAKNNKNKVEKNNCPPLNLDREKNNTNLNWSRSRNNNNQQPEVHTRGSSVSSVSSVDSDYQRDRTDDKYSNPFYRSDLSMSQMNETPTYFGPPKSKTNDSSEVKSTKPTEKINKLTMENLKKFNTLNSYNLTKRLSTMSISSIESTNKSVEDTFKIGCIGTPDKIKTDIVTRKFDAMSISSVESKHSTDEENYKLPFRPGQSSATIYSNTLTKQLSTMSISSAGSSNTIDSLSVMDRVKQSYMMLDYKSNPNKQPQDMQNRLYKSASSQSLNKKNPCKKDKPIKPFDSKFGGSTQSLNLQSNSSINNYSDGYKPSTAVRDSSVESNRSLTFMPTFAKK